MAVNLPLNNHKFNQQERVKMRPVLFSILLFISSVTYADFGGALSGAANAFGEIADQEMQHEAAKQRILLQHKMEMERLQRIEDAQIREEQRRAEAAKQDRIKAEEQAKRNQINILSLSHPDWKEISRSEDFAKWQGLLPSETQQAINDSWDADFLTKVFTAFKDWKSKQNIKVAKRKKMKSE